MTDLERDATQIAERLLVRAGEAHFADSRMYADLVEMAKQALKEKCKQHPGHSRYTSAGCYFELHDRRAA